MLAEKRCWMLASTVIWYSYCVAEVFGVVIHLVHQGASVHQTTTYHRIFDLYTSIAWCV